MKKMCYLCMESKPIEDFSRCISKFDGHQNRCKKCRSQMARDAGPEQKTALREASLAWRCENKDRVGVIYRRWWTKNRQQQLDRARDWKRKNPEKTAALGDKRIRRQMRQRPVWANRFFMQEAYHLARLRTISTGFRWHVDHVVPLRHPLVSGLHCEFNLRVIPAAENLKKKNRFEI